MNNIISLICIAGSHMKFTMRRTMMIFILLIQPLFFVLLTWLIYRHTDSAGTGTRIFIASGLTTLWSGIVFSSLSDLERERSMGTLELIFASAHGLKGAVIPKTAGNLFLCVLPMTGLWAGIHYVLNRPVIIYDPWKTAISAMILLISLFSISLFLSCFFALSRNSRVIMNAFEFPFFLISGFVFPITVLPDWLRILSWLSPLTYPVHLLRSAMLGETVFLTWNGLFVISISLILLFMCLTFFAFNIIEKSTRISGVFTLS